MNNLEWYELAVCIRRRTGIYIGDRQFDYFAGIKLDPSEVSSVDGKRENWSLEDLPDEFRSAIDELLERMPEFETPREIEIANSAKDIGWIEAMSKQSEWWSLQQSQNSRLRAAPKIKKKTAARQGHVAIQYSSFISKGMTDIEARKAIIKDRFDKNLKPKYNLS